MQTKLRLQFLSKICIVAIKMTLITTMPCAIKRSIIIFIMRSANSYFVSVY